MAEQIDFAAALAEAEEQVFAATLETEELGARERLSELTHGGGREDFGPVNGDITYGTVFQQRGEMADEDFDFGQFRHWRRNSYLCSRSKASTSSSVVWSKCW